MIGFDALINAWWLFLLVPLIAIYFLKLKRQSLQVPSLALWSLVLEDRRVNSPFQRFKRHLLLLLQILLLLAFVLAAMLPFRMGAAPSSERLPILIDVSASMAATDEEGQSRLDLAKQQIEEMIASVGDERELSLVAFDQQARRLTDFTNDARVLRAALDDLTVSDVPSDPSAGLRLIQAMGRAVPIERAVLISDGNLPPELDLSLAYDLDYRVLPAAAPNLGIVGCQARANRSRGWQLLVVVHAAGATRSGDVTITIDGRKITTEPVVVPADTSERLLFDIHTAHSGLAEVALTVDGHDSLASDNVAWVNLPQPRPLQVYVDPELPTWRQVLSHVPNISFVGATAMHDLHIAREAAPDAAAAVFTVGHIPDRVSNVLTRYNEGTGVTDWQRSAALLRHVELGDVLTMNHVQLATGADLIDLENLGYQVLVHGDRGPLLLRREANGRVMYRLLVNDQSTTLPYRVAFPVMVANLVLEARELAGLSEVAGTRTGVLQLDGFTPDQTWNVVGPDDQQHAVLVGPDGMLGGIPAPQVGTYQLTGPGDDQVLTASLLHEFESSLAAVEELQFDQVSIAALGGIQDSERPLWRYLALAALTLLLVEWWYYQRRPGGW